MQYKEVVKLYFKEKEIRFLRKYKSFEDLNEANNEALEEWKENKKQLGNKYGSPDIEQHRRKYHRHANLSTAFKTIKRKMNNSRKK